MRRSRLRLWRSSGLSTSIKKTKLFECKRNWNSRSRKSRRCVMSRRALSQTRSRLRISSWTASMRIEKKCCATSLSVTLKIRLQVPIKRREAQQAQVINSRISARRSWSTRSVQASKVERWFSKRYLAHPRKANKIWRSSVCKQRPLSKVYLKWRTFEVKGYNLL